MITYLYYLFGLVALYFLARFIFDILLRGFAPIVSSRPWLVQKIIEGIELKPHPQIISLKCGKSGFLHAIGQKYPTAELIGYEHSLYPYLVALIQSWIRFSRIKVVKSSVYGADVKTADLIYCYLDVELVRDLGKKFKFDCQPGTLIISNGYVIPGLEPSRIMELKPEDVKSRTSILSRDRYLFKTGRTKSKKEKKIFFYEI